MNYRFRCCLKGRLNPIVNPKALNTKFGGVIKWFKYSGPAGKGKCLRLNKQRHNSVYLSNALQLNAAMMESAEQNATASEDRGRQPFHSAKNIFLKGNSSDTAGKSRIPPKYWFFRRLEGKQNRVIFGAIPGNVSAFRRRMLPFLPVHSISSPVPDCTKSEH